MKPSKQALALASLSLCLAPAFSHAQAAVSQLDDIVVTPSRMAQTQSTALGDVTVIGRDELSQAGQDSLAQVLSRHQGIQIFDQGGPQSPTSLFLRGTNANQTLVLVDGIRINSSGGGYVNWNVLDPAMIERVEILRGAASSLYGSDAIGGVINIITRQGEGDRPLRAYGNFGLGTYGTVKSNAGVSGAQGGWNYAFSAGFASSDGYSATNRQAPFGAHHPDSDGYDQHSFSGSLGYRWKPGHHVNLTAYNSYINGDYDNGEFSHPLYAITRQQAYTLSSTDQITDRWQSVLRFGLAKEMGDDRDPYFSSTYGSLQRSYSWQNNLQLNDQQSLSLIMERLEERALGTTAFQQDRRNTNSANLIWRGHFNRHHLQASVRNDNISGYGNQATGSLAYDYDFAPGWKAGVAANTGFKAPTMTELYGPAFWGSNPDLEPEKSRNIEASLRYTSTQYEFGVTAFRNKVRQLIAYSDGMNQNVDSATMQGVTLTASRHWGNTSIHTGVDFLDARDDETGLRLPRRAKQVYRIGVDHQIGQLALGGQYRFVGHRYDELSNRTRLGGYGLLDLTASYTFTPKVAVQVRWNNVFDKNYANAYGYNMPGSNVFVNLAVKM